MWIHFMCRVTEQGSSFFLPVSLLWSQQCSVGALPKAPPPWTSEVTHVGFMNQALRIQSNRCILSCQMLDNTVVKHLKYCYFACKYCRITSNYRDYCLISEMLAYPAALIWFYKIQILKNHDNIYNLQSLLFYIIGSWTSVHHTQQVVNPPKWPL